MSGALNFLAASIEPGDWLDDSWDAGTNPDLWIYRKRTEAILRRYFQMSVEVGRLPSILGKEFFRSKVTSYRVASFEEVVVFVHDVERNLAKLDRLSQELIGRVILQGFSYEEAARFMGCARRTIDRRLPEALDRLSEIFLEVGILRREACQEGERDEKFVIM